MSHTRLRLITPIRQNVRSFARSVGSKNTPKYLRILKYPHPQLRAENETITEFDTELKNVVKNMFYSMYMQGGVGLAAPQVGINKRLLVFNEHGDPSRKDSEIVLINPQIINMSPECDQDEELCLSFPKISGIITRSKRVQLKYQDINGNHSRIEFMGLLARIVQHEYDHIDQVLFIDRFTDEDREKNGKWLELYIERFGVGAAV